MGQIRYDLIAFYLLVALLILSFCSSCTVTKYVPIETVHNAEHTKTDTFIQRDSVRDSIIVSLWKNGDTVYTAKEVYKTRYLMRNTLKTDTFIQRDTIPKIIPPQHTKTTFNTITKRLRIAALLVLLVLTVYYFNKKT